MVQATELTETELDRIAEAAWALPPGIRAAFTQQVIGEWQQVPPAARGPGPLHRIIAGVQSNYLKLAVGTGGNTSRYDRPNALRAKANKRAPHIKPHGA